LTLTIYSDQKTNYHSALYRVTEELDYVAQALKQTSREATILLYAPALDPHLRR